MTWGDGDDGSWLVGGNLSLVLFVILDADRLATRGQSKWPFLENNCAQFLALFRVIDRRQSTRCIKLYPHIPPPLSRTQCQLSVSIHHSCKPVPALESELPLNRLNRPIVATL